ncbi:DUF1993 family protein [Teredinibacter waterburyi]|uniref:DUF1993 family protein n=1 Tax=Teredinibacter waterburyi TaxID=1500538 RepID=UPI00165F3E3A|nr:DUF1993 family protein [Teredinibacter waterburyi]
MINPASFYIHYLCQLKKLLLKIKSMDRLDVMNERLIHNMFDLKQQARTAIGFTLRSCCPIAGRDIVNFGDDECSINSLLDEISKTIDYLAEIPAEEFSFSEETTIETAAGFADLEFTPMEYFLSYSFPNFMFHYCIVYAIARKSGLEIGKADFDGYHKYPLGFDFTDSN